MATHVGLLLLWLALATTTSAATTQAPVITTAPVAGKDSCFTTGCDHHASPSQCTAGQWSCTALQYCHATGNADGTLHMKCEAVDHYQACMDHISHNAPECKVSIQAHCQYCCRDADCVHGLASASLNCVDSLPNNDCHHLAADCANAAVSQVCHRTCGVCGGVAALTTAAPAVVG